MIDSCCEENALFEGNAIVDILSSVKGPHACAFWSVSPQTSEGEKREK